MSVPTVAFLVPLIMVVAGLWFWLISRLLALVLRPLDRKLARLAAHPSTTGEGERWPASFATRTYRCQEPDHEHVRCLHVYCIDICPLCDGAERDQRRCSCY